MREIVGIVGSSQADFSTYLDQVKKIVLDIPLDSIIVTGDANGIDYLVRRICIINDRTHSIIYSKSSNFEDGYKKRNEIIASYADRIISIALPKSTKACYHCNRDDHEKTAGCYTGKLNGNYEVIILK